MSALKVMVIPVTPFQQNASVLCCLATRRCAAVDPGGELDRLEAAMTEMGARLEKVPVTHGHLDHASGVAELAERHGVPIEGPHHDDLFWIEQLP